jgi:hypothetical protein
MAIPVNILQQVQTYQASSLAYLLNLTCFVSTFNTKFNNFEDIEANLGTTVTFDLPPRAMVTNSLVYAEQPAVQLVQNLAITQQMSSSYAFNATQRIFNIDKAVDSYMGKLGKSAMHALANKIERLTALNIDSNMINNDPNSASYGLPDSTSGPFRFFGDGVTPINSYQQLAQMVANFKDFGAVHEGIKVYLSNLQVPSIVGSGLNQFVPRRNDEIAMSWEVGSFGNPVVQYYESNMLPIHTSGNVGNNGTTLTVIATNDPTGANITSITFSGAGVSDANAIFYSDKFQFQDGVSGKPNLRFLTYLNDGVSNQPVQFRATAAAASDGSGHVTVSIYPPLQSVISNNRNISINNNIVAGMQVKVLPNHKCGLVLGGGAGYISVPRLPEQDPFYSASAYDDDTGVSMRMTYGSVLGQNTTIMGYDVVMGATIVPEYAMLMALPLSQ